MYKNPQQKLLKNILCSKDIQTNINNNLNDLLLIIPEIKNMIGFEHNHPHHHLDVWRHKIFALSLSPNIFNVRLALLLHDIGKPHCFQIKGELKHFKDHPKVSKDIAENILNRLNYKKEYINFICEIIENHDTPLNLEYIQQNPKLCKILFKVQKCDALAHNPIYNAKRLEYIKNTKKLFKQINNKN